MERLDVPTKFLTLVEPGTKLPLEWSEEMSESLRESVEGDYKRIMAEHFFKMFLTNFEIQPIPSIENEKKIKRTFHRHDATKEMVSSSFLHVYKPVEKKLEGENSMTQTKNLMVSAISYLFL